MRDMEAKGRSNKRRGGEHHNAKLSEEDVCEIRRLHAAGFNRTKLAAQFKISLSTVKMIAWRKAWKHLS